jgi:hypothetical protein
MALGVVALEAEQARRVLVEALGKLDGRGPRSVVQMLAVDRRPTLDIPAQYRSRFALGLPSALTWTYSMPASRSAPLRAVFEKPRRRESGSSRTSTSRSTPAFSACRSEGCQGRSKTDPLTPVENGPFCGSGGARRGGERVGRAGAAFAAREPSGRGPVARWRSELAARPREGTGGPFLRLAVQLDVHELVVEGDPVADRLDLTLRLGVGPRDVVALA